MNKPALHLPKNAIWEHFKGPGEPAHFYHANGFHPGAYGPFLSRLGRRFRLSALALRAVWPGADARAGGGEEWGLYADDLIAFIEAQCRPPVIGMGHSMGASCTALAANRRPDLFKALVLIEPAMVSRPLAALLRLTPKPLAAFFQPIRGTLKKRDRWPDRESFLADYRKFRGYRRFGEETFRAMARHGVREAPGGGVELTFPKIWEARNYTRAPFLIHQLRRLSMPCVAIRGEPSLFFGDALWREWQKRCPDAVFKENRAFGHLMPLESPSACQALIEEGLAEVL
ncbi:Pimeloyl-ACP methyl ester carboxylesterase [Candidatus Desulfarcum epimagneticum]|uniref:Pimeloyl-ACP methyl ester carboxylesterase n=1 Tax=uncultured Desulfobacteraceae bacterium TaxID=218296 RepID=A0A484HRG4_9BACT|nr:Pimeloyl-ACP methyl ester carboxylesterase [uncultured Desulfobacteraceae bacterium]